MPLVLVHNNEPDRIVSFRSSFTELAAALGLKVQEVFQQPPIVPYSRLASFRRIRRHEAFVLDWSEHQFGTRPSPPPGLLKGIVQQALDPAVRRRHAIEAALAGKHTAAWRDFIAGDEAFLIVVESDAVVKADSLARLRAILSLIDPHSRTYVDLGGGFEPAELGTDRLNPKTVVEGVVQLSKFATNTTCAYLLTRPLATEFLAILAERPEMRDVVPDWTINFLGYQLDRRGTPVDQCWHTWPPVFVHGSMANVFSSGIR